MESSKESYWAKVLFREFVSHFIEMSDEQIVKDVKKSIVALTKLSCDGDSFGSKMVAWANERRMKYQSSAANGAFGGRPKKNGVQNEEKKPEQLVYGTQANVFLTQDQFNELAVRIGNVNERDRIVNNLSNALADGSKKSANHFATLSSWIDYRMAHPRQEEGDNNAHYETVSEHNRRVYQNGLLQLEEMKKNGRFGFG